MKSFLHYVAKDLIATYGNDMSKIAVVFPNKRAALFLNEELALCSDSPVWAPTYLTISDLFRQYSPLTAGDSIKLVCDLHKSYTQITGASETLDHFYDWGKLLISDFDDIDKNMADARLVFSNISNLHELDDVSYLSEEQIEALRNFFGNFSADHNSRLKEMFINLWAKLFDIYTDFRSRLRLQGFAYEGMLYRDVIEEKSFKPQFKKYIFVGFNLLQKVEQRLFAMLKSEGLADFYWDYDQYYMPDRKANNTPAVNEAGKYISLYSAGDMFGNSFHIDTKEIYDNFRKPKDIRFMKAKTENIQARYATEWLKEKNRIDAGKRTAIVMCDEGLLQSIVHCLPPEAKSINITTGYPLDQTPVASFVSQLLDLYTMGSRNDGTLRISFVRTVLQHPYTGFLSENAHGLLKELKNKRILYPRPSELSADEHLALLFDFNGGNAGILKRMAEVQKRISQKSKEPLFQESVFNMHNILQRLATLIESGDLDVDLHTMQRLTKQIISTTSIPFHGEPAVGIQIMGTLETRNLDFDHLLLLSCNDEKMPRGIRDSSFIPYSIRKAYGLTTVDNKVAIYSYYFHRLLQRSKDVTIVYNSSTEGTSRGEMSRFMLQMMVESPHDINHMMLTVRQTIINEPSFSIPKDDAVMKKIMGIDSLSPSAINKYISCPLKFYYNYIANIKEPDEDLEDELSSRAFGNIFHHTSEALYKYFAKSGRQITASLIDRLAEKTNIENIVDEMFLKEMFGDNGSMRRNLKYNGMQLLSREVLIKYVERLLEIDKSMAPFSILAIEKPVDKEITIDTSLGKKTISVWGIIDRLDLITSQTDGKPAIRVVDYKTGGKDISVPARGIEDVFNPEKADMKTHANYYLQALLYSIIVGEKEEYAIYNTPVKPALIFIQHAFDKDYSPVLKFGKEDISNAAEYKDEFMLRLKSVIEEIFNPDVDFVGCSLDDTCAFCPYQSLCRKN